MIICISTRRFLVYESNAVAAFSWFLIFDRRTWRTCKNSTVYSRPVWYFIDFMGWGTSKTQLKTCHRNVILTLQFSRFLCHRRYGQLCYSLMHIPDLLPKFFSGQFFSRIVHRLIYFKHQLRLNYIFFSFSNRIYFTMRLRKFSRLITFELIYFQLSLNFMIWQVSYLIFGIFIQLTFKSFVYPRLLLLYDHLRSCSVARLLFRVTLALWVNFLLPLAFRKLSYYHITNSWRWQGIEATSFRSPGGDTTTQFFLLGEFQLTWLSSCMSLLSNISELGLLGSVNNWGATATMSSITLNNPTDSSKQVSTSLCLRLLSLTPPAPPEVPKLFWDSESEEEDWTSDSWVRNSEKAQFSWFKTLKKKLYDT